MCQPVLVKRIYGFPFQNVYVQRGALNINILIRKGFKQDKRVSSLNMQNACCNYVETEFDGVVNRLAVSV